VPWKVFSLPNTDHSRLYSAPLVKTDFLVPASQLRACGVIAEVAVDTLPPVVNDEVEIMQIQ
jgi:hypothetical protein